MMMMMIETVMAKNINKIDTSISFYLILLTLLKIVM
jgi:hypothetical protein